MSNSLITTAENLPAASAASIPVGLGQFADCDPSRPDELPHLLNRLR